MPRSRPRSADTTRSEILEQIRSSVRISRVELAEKTGFTEATISTVVRRIIEEGLVVEAGYSESTGGKRRTLLDIDRSARYGVGVSLARDRITAVVADLAGQPVGTSRRDGADDLEPDLVIARVVEQVDELIEELGIDRDRIVGIGVAGAGPLDAASGTLQGRQPSPVWRGYALEERLERASGMRVVLDNDATCAALGEHWTDRRGAVPAVSATVYMDDGIGCGILIDGTVFHGMSSNAGEVGHISLESDGPPCHCGSRGCVEVYASPAAVSARALQDLELVDELGLVPRADRRDNFEAVAIAAASGHRDALALIEDAASYLARGIVVLSNILDLDEVHLSGPGFAAAGELYAAVAQRHLDAGTFMRRIHPVRVHVSNIGADAAAIGAAALILQHELTPHTAVFSRRARA